MIFSKDKENDQASVANPQPAPQAGYQQPGGNGKQSSMDPKFEDLAYRQFGLLQRLGYRIADSIGITNDLKRARRYLEALEAKEEQMDNAIDNYFTEKRAIEKVITDFSKANLDTEREIKGLEEEVNRLNKSIGELGKTIEEMEKDESKFNEYTEKRKQLIELKEEYEHKKPELDQKKREKSEREQELKREQDRLDNYSECTDDLVEERADLGRYISTISDIIRDEENLRKIPVVKRIRGR